MKKEERRHNFRVACVVEFREQTKMGGDGSACFEPFNWIRRKEGGRGKGKEKGSIG